MQDIQNSLGYLLNTAARLIKGEFNKKLQDYDITTSQWALLKDLYTEELKKKREESFMQISIANRLSSDRTTVSQIIERLDKKGLVVKVNNPNDRRSFLIKLSSEGKKLVMEVDGLSEKVISKATNDLNKVQQDELIKYLSMIIENLKS